MSDKKKKMELWKLPSKMFIEIQCHQSFEYPTRFFISNLRLFSIFETMRRVPTTRITYLPKQMLTK